MDRDEALRLLRGGEDGVKEWNRRRDQGDALTALGDLDVSVAKSLGEVRHGGLSTIGLDTFATSQNGIPGDFLKQCGLVPWEILQAATSGDTR